MSSELYPITDEAQEALNDLIAEHQTDDPLGALEEMSGTGICLECGETRDGCEPDASGYECSECGAHAVMGMETAIAIYS